MLKNINFSYDFIIQKIQTQLNNVEPEAKSPKVEQMEVEPTLATENQTLSQSDGRSRLSELSKNPSFPSLFSTNSSLESLQEQMEAELAQVAVSNLQSVKELEAKVRLNKEEGVQELNIQYTVPKHMEYEKYLQPHDSLYAENYHQRELDFEDYGEEEEERKQLQKEGKQVQKEVEMEEQPKAESDQKSFEDFYPGFKELSYPALAYLKNQISAKKVEDKFEMDALKATIHRNL